MLVYTSFFFNRQILEESVIGICIHGLTLTDMQVRVHGQLNSLRKTTSSEQQRESAQSSSILSITPSLGKQLIKNTIPSHLLLLKFIQSAGVIYYVYLPCSLFKPTRLELPKLASRTVQISHHGPASKEDTGRRGRESRVANHSPV